MVRETFDTEPIRSVHKAVIEKLRMDNDHKSSSHAFPSLYLWQNAMGLSIKLTEDYFAVKSLIDGENAWFFPCGNSKGKYGFINEHIHDKTFSLCYLRKCDVDWLEENFPGKWDITRAEEADEYICNISEYINLSGSKFSEIRRKINKITREHTVTTAMITEENMQDALSVVSEWRQIEHNVSEKHLTDDHIAETALSNMKFLGVEGIVLYSDGEPVCVFAGFQLTDDIVDVLIGKCALDAPKGIVYYGLHEYLISCCSNYTYCNHEEDLGIEGIRHLKNSLCPIGKIQMWEAFLK